MKILVIPDIHGNWNDALRNIYNNYKNVDKVVTLGDYVDDFDSSLNGKVMIDGFTELCALARENKDKFCICIGNHDNSYYVPPHLHDAVCSGHRWEYAKDYKEMFDKNADLLNVFYMFDGVLFSHGGYSLEFNQILSDRIIRLEYEQKIPRDRLDVNKINEVFHSDPDLFQHRGYSPSGDSIGESFLWIRPNSLLDSKWDDSIKVQVVGHTECGRQFLSYKDKRLILIDSPSHNDYMIIDTDNLNYDWAEYEPPKKEMDFWEALLL